MRLSEYFSSLFDKKHLFTLAKEAEVYTPGKKRIMVELKRLRKMLPCYLLWCCVSRFGYRNTDELYDLLLIVANWPEKRAAHWRALLAARAIENQAYVIGLNRVGHDGNGGSTILAIQVALIPTAILSTINAMKMLLYLLYHWRWGKIITRCFAFLNDADDFALKS